MKTKSLYLRDLEFLKDEYPGFPTIKSRYRLLVKKYNDGNGTEKNAEKFRLINEAYNAIKDEKFLPEEAKPISSVDLESVNKSLFDFINTASYTVNLKKSKHKIIKIGNIFVNLDCEKLTREKLLLINKRLLIRIVP